MWHRPGAEPLHDETSRLGGVGGYVAVDVSAEFVAGAHMADRIGGIAQVNRLGTECGLRLDSDPPARLDGLPKTATAATLSAYAAGSGLPKLMLPNGTPATISITVAPCE